MNFLPVSYKELLELNIERPDFVLVTGDAYVDHPSFGAAVIGRLLQKKGFTVGVIAQPNYRDMESFAVFGEPRLGFLVTAGNVDSMVNHFSVAKKRRKTDAYSPGGVAGLRPDRATIVYSNKIRQKYKNVPIIIGGLEASLRRLAHYDYWEDGIRRSILLDSAADLLVYGMGEGQIVEIAEALQSGLPVKEITFIPGTAYVTKDPERAGDYIPLPSFDEVKASKRTYAQSFLLQMENTDHISAKPLVEQYNTLFVVQNPPYPPLTTRELDSVYSLKYMRTYHPMYEKGVPAIEEVRFSIISNRGCFGGCSFCALTFHQGRQVTSRSHSSILKEAEEITWLPDFKGYIHDVGGPTANFRSAACKKQLDKGVCKNKQCLSPKPCKNLVVDHSDYLSLLRKVRELPRIKKVFVRSGIRYDYLIYDKDSAFFKELCQHHISGQLKVAPEHISPNVLEKMGKPKKEVYEKFVNKYKEINAAIGKEQYLVPYLMSSHPGSTIDDAVMLAEYLQQNKIRPEQVQDFYPTPGTLSTVMYYTELDPRTMEPVYVPKSQKEKAIQRALIQATLPQNQRLVKEGLSQTTSKLKIKGEYKKERNKKDEQPKLYKHQRKQKAGTGKPSNNKRHSR